MEDVLDVIIKYFTGRRQIKLDVWISITVTVPAWYEDKLKRSMMIHVARCGGGAYYQAGSINVDESAVTLSVKSVKAVHYRRHDREEFRFDIASPTLIEDVSAMLDRIAVNHLKVEDLSNKRSWSRHKRKATLSSVRLSREGIARV